ncbi:MAG TPA: S-layer homology domain-containing protein [Chloroflexia bacterium]|nr:S-layer homology domain-containing protein [Chloroflexia bacterium]
MQIRLSALIGLLGSMLLLGTAAGAAGLRSAGPAATPQAVQDFQDVPTNSPFYTYVHNLFVDGVVGGYTCGGPGEPCVPPGNLPYFRPGANVTRGQNAKFTDNGRRVLTGAYAGSSPDNGLFSAINTDFSTTSNTGLYGQGATGVWGDSHTTGTTDGFGGYFINFNTGGSTGRQIGAYAEAYGWGLMGVSVGSTSGQTSAGVVGQSVGAGGAGGVFTATQGANSVGLVAAGRAGAALAGDGAAVFASNDGLDVGGMGGPSYGIFVQQPTGDTNWSLYGNAHIHGSNIASADYESEVVYDGAAPLALGRVVALDPANAMGGPLGVLPADAAQADAAIGVVSYRLTTALVNGVAKPMIDAPATAVQPGDHAYITILGRVALPLPVGAKVGARLAVGANGTAALAATGDPSFGRVASQPDATGVGYVLVDFK